MAGAALARWKYAKGTEIHVKAKRFALLFLLLPVSAGFAVSEGLEDGSNNARSGAVPFTAPDQLTGALTSDGASPPTDYFSFSTPGGKTYTITSSTTLSLDADVDVENGSGTVLASGTNFGNENFQFTSPSAATYYVVVYNGGSLSGSAGNYTVNVSAPAGVTDWGLY